MSSLVPKNGPVRLHSRAMSVFAAANASLWDAAAVETALRKRGFTQYTIGYLPLSIVDGGQQLVKDFAYWRAASVGARAAAAQMANHVSYGARPRPLASRITAEEAEAHEAFVKKYLKEKSLWPTGA